MRPSRRGRTEPQAAQQPQLVRDGRLRQLQDGREVAHAQLAMGQRIQDADARRIAKRAEVSASALDRRPGSTSAARSLLTRGQVNLDEVADFSIL